MPTGISAASSPSRVTAIGAGALLLASLGDEVKAYTAKKAEVEVGAKVELDSEENASTNTAAKVVTEIASTKAAEEAAGKKNVEEARPKAELESHEEAKADAAKRAEKEAKAKTAELKIGDSVRIVGGPNAGEIGRLLEDDGSSDPYKVQVPDGRISWYKKHWVVAAEASVVMAEPKWNARASAPPDLPPGSAAVLRALSSVIRNMVPPSQASTTKATAPREPDRHFEVVVKFELGHCGVCDVGEQTLQTVAAAICMRTRLCLKLLSCPDAIENKALAENRLAAIEEFFAKEGIRTERSRESARVSSPNGSPGVICKLLLEHDRELRDFFIAREDCDEFPISRSTRSTIAWLESEFETVRH